MGATVSVPDEAEFDSPLDAASVPILADFGPQPAKVQLVVKEKLFSWSGDSFKIKTPDGLPFHGLQVKGKVWEFRDRTTLLDGTGQPVAVCQRKFECLSQSFKIYSLSPVYPEQKPSAQEYEGRPLYTFAEVKRVPFETEQQVTFTGQGSPAVTINRAGSYWPKKRVVRVQGHPAALMEGGTWGDTWNSYLLSIRPGVDPCLIVCLTVICDQMDEE